MNITKLSFVGFVARTTSYAAVGVVGGMLVSKSAPSTTITKHSVVANDLRIVDSHGKTRVEISATGKSGAPMVVLRNNSGEVDAALVSTPSGNSGLVLVKPPSLHGVFVGFRDGASEPVVSIVGGHKVENLLPTTNR